jgi:hypothetical protein
MPNDYSRKRQTASASSCPSSWQVSRTSLGKAKLLEEQDGGALREGIRGLSQALMETEG